ncbi:MAG: hypothetical protein KAS72_03540 [Phycisphaerales bacterium]|nr:hypothetical protein [Phycisphaerales bacterium]
MMPADVHADDPRRLTANIPCIHCGHNLRGVLLTERCPECGQAVADSTRTTLLHFAELKWLRSLTRGLRLLLIYGCCRAAVVGLRVLTAWLTVTLGTDSWFSELDMAVQRMMASAGTAAIWTAWQAVALWFMVTPSPSDISSERGRFARRIACGGLALHLIWPWVVDSLSGVISPTALLVLAIAGSVVSMVAFFALFTYARSLTSRVPSAHLSLLTGFARWVVPVYYVRIAVIQAMTLWQIALTQTGSGQGQLWVDRASHLSSGPALLVAGLGWACAVVIYVRLCRTVRTARVVQGA